MCYFCAEYINSVMLLETKVLEHPHPSFHWVSWWWRCVTLPTTPCHLHFLGSALIKMFSLPVGFQRWGRLMSNWHWLPFSRQSCEGSPPWAQRGHWPNSSTSASLCCLSLPPPLELIAQTSHPTALCYKTNFCGYSFLKKWKQQICLSDMFMITVLDDRTVISEAVSQQKR